MHTNKENRMSKVHVVQDEEKPVTKDVLATAILKISESMESLQKSGLNVKAISILVHHSLPNQKYGKGKFATLAGVRAVFDALADLRKDYCK